jgi:hypothetical protein
MGKNFKFGCFGFIIFGAFCLSGLGLLVLSSGLSGDVVEGASPVPLITLGIVWLAIGLILAVIFSILLTVAWRNNKLLQKYTGLITVKKKLPLEYLALNTGKSLQKVAADFRKLIGKGSFSGAIITDDNFILFPNCGIGSLQTVKCKNCGGFTDITVGYDSKCTYCGAALDIAGE